VCECRSGMRSQPEESREEELFSVWGECVCVCVCVKPNLWSSVYGDTESPPSEGKPSPSTSQWPDVHPPSFVTIRLRQYIAVYLVGSSMPTLHSWLRHLANPLRRIFQLQ